MAKKGEEGITDIPPDLSTLQLSSVSSADQLLELEHHGLAQSWLIASSLHWK